MITGVLFVQDTVVGELCSRCCIDHNIVDFSSGFILRKRKSVSNAAFCEYFAKFSNRWVIGFGVQVTDKDGG